MRSKLLVVLGIMILLVGFNSCKLFKGSNPMGPDDIGDDNGNGGNNNDCSSHPPMGKVDDTIKSCIFEITLKSVEVAKTLCDGRFIAGKLKQGEWKYVITEVNVKNIATGDNAIGWYISYTLFSLKDSGGSRYEQDDVDYLSQIFSCFPGLFMWGQCKNYAPGEETGFLKLIFELPKTSSGLTLKFYSGETQNTIEFNLGI